MKHRSNLLTRMLAVTLAVSMLLDVNGVTALAESADALSGADGYAVTEEAPAEGTTEGVDEWGDLFLEPEPIDAQAYAYLGSSGNPDDYQVDTSLGYKVRGTSVTPGRNSAEIHYYANIRQSDSYMYILYAESGSANDFFPNATSTTDISAYQYENDRAYYSDSGSTITLSGLRADTTYLYRFALRQGDSATGYTYYFLSKPAAFTTKESLAESQVRIENVEIIDYGYFLETVEFTVQNPEGEDILFMDVADQGSTSTTKQSSSMPYRYGYRDGQPYYRCSVATNAGPKEIRVAVEINGETVFIRQGIELKSRDKSDLTFSFSEGGSENMRCVMVDVSPLYDLDERNMELRLYYRKQGETDYRYTSDMVSVSEGGAFASFSGSAGESYDYYAVVCDSDGAAIPGAALGSAESPKTFAVSQDYNAYADYYTYDDFTDKALFYYLAGNGTNWKEKKISKSILNTKTELYIRNSDAKAIYEATGQAVSSLDDLDKMPCLHSLKIYHHSITAVSDKLKALPFLRDVDLRFNEITTLPDLSGCKWATLDLSHNLLTEDAIAAANLPAKLAEKLGKQDTNTLILGEPYDGQLYIYQGKHQLYFKYKDFLTDDETKKYTFTVNAGGRQSAELSGQRMYNDILYIEDIGMELAPGVEYPATITVKAYGKEILSQAVILCYADIDISNSLESYVARQNLVQNALTDISVRGFYEHEVSDFKEFSLLDHNTHEKKAVTTDITKNNTTNTNYGLIYYSSSYYHGKFELYDVPDGDYDLQVEMVNGNIYTIENKVHITTNTIVTIASLDSEYDSTGDYCYIKIKAEGYALDTDKLWPVLTNEDGSIEYTEKVWGKTTFYRSSGTYSKYSLHLYKLRKKENWAEIDTSDRNVSLNVKLMTADGYAVEDTRSSTTIRATSFAGSSVRTAYYNAKREVFEYILTQNVPAGTYVEGKLYTKSNDEDSLFAVAEGKVDANHRVSLQYKTLDGKVYTPSYAEANEIYHSLWVPGYISSSNRRCWTLSTSSPITLRLNGTASYAEGASSLNVYAYCTPGQAETDALYVRLSDAEGNVLATTPEALQYEPLGSDTNTSSSYDYYRNKAWNLGRELAAGTYTLTLYGTVDGAEKVFATKTIYVVGDGFWQDSQSVSYNNYQSTSWQADVANVTLHLPGLITEEMDAHAAQSLWADNKLALTVCDADGVKQEVTVTPYKAIATGTLYLTVSDLDENADGYYFRLTKDGAVAQNPSTGTDYYTGEYGIWSARRGDTYAAFGGYRYRNEYSYFFAMDYARDLPSTIEIYKQGDLDAPVRRLTVEQDDLNYNGYYYFTDEDMEGLYSDELYHLVAISAVGSVRTDDGFLPAKEKAPETGEGGEDEPEPVVVLHQVQFIVNDSVYKTFTVLDGKTVDMSGVENPAPAEGQGKFKGWYVSGTDTLWDAAEPVTADLKLEARFAAGGEDEPEPVVVQHQVQFIVNDSVYKTFTVLDGKTVDMSGVENPAPAEGQGKFKGWYVSGTDTLWDAAEPVTADLKLEARFAAGGSGDNTNPGESALDAQVDVTAETGSLYLVQGQKFYLGEGKWISSDSKSLAISKKNEATAKKNADGVIIRAADVNKEYTVSIVTPKLSETKCTVLAGDDSKSLSVINLGTNNQYAENYNIYWTSSNPEIVTVDDGKLHAISKGTATVTAYVNGKAYNSKVSVVDAMTVGKLGADAAFTLSPMQTTALKFSSGYNLKKTVEWVSTVNGEAVEMTAVLKKNGKLDYYENGIVKITAAGKVTAIGAGTTILTAKDATGRTQTFTVTVGEPAVKKIYVNQGASKAVKLYNVKAAALNFETTEGNGKAEVVKGKLKGISAGETTLTAAYMPCVTETGAGFTYTLQVYVEDPSLNTGDGLTLKSGLNYNLTLKVGEKYTIEEKAVYQPVLYKSSKPAVAFVNEAGVITARGVGTAKITAKVNGKKVTINVTVPK